MSNSNGNRPVDRRANHHNYNLEINPWTPNNLLNNSMLCRGAIISAWGYIETTLIELAIRASHMDQYCSLSARYPYRLEGRINFMRKVLDSEGPFFQFRRHGHTFLDRFERAAELRHILAHAKMQILVMIIFVDYSPAQNGMISRRYRRFTIDQLEQMARKATRLSRLMHISYEAINRAGFLPPLGELS